MSEPAGLTLDVTAPAALTVVNGTYDANPFTVTSRITNTGGATAMEVKASASLPGGLTLASGSITQVIGDIPPGELRDVTWTVRYRFQALKRTRAEGNKPPLSPARVGRPPATGRYDLPSALGAKGRRNLVHVQLRFHSLLLCNVVDGEILVPDHQANFALARIAPHRPAETRELSELSGILNVDGSRVTVDDDGLVLYECAASFVISPDGSTHLPAAC